MKPRLPALLCSAIAAALVIFSAGRPAVAQTTGSAIEVPGVRNFVAAAVGVVPDYLGSDDYTVGAAPAALIKFGGSERYLRLVVTDSEPCVRTSTINSAVPPTGMIAG